MYASLLDNFGKISAFSWPQAAKPRDLLANQSHVGAGATDRFRNHRLLIQSRFVPSSHRAPLRLQILWGNPRNIKNKVSELE